MNRSPGWPNLLGLVNPEEDQPEALQFEFGTAPGWVVFHRNVASDSTVYGGADWSGFAELGIAVICYLEWDPGNEGTIPDSQYTSAFANRSREFVQATHGCHVWVIGNEPNRSSQWPGAATSSLGESDASLEVIPSNYMPERYGHLTGRLPEFLPQNARPITPTQYADCLKQVSFTIRSVPDRDDDLILCAPIAPWNSDYRSATLAKW